MLKISKKLMKLFQILIDTATAITKATDIMQNNDINNHSAYISANFCFLIKVIKKSEI